MTNSIVGSIPVERLDLDLFRGLAPNEGYRARIFGGHVIGTQGTPVEVPVPMTK